MNHKNKLQHHDLRAYLDSLYDQYNRREFVSPDPLQFLYEYGSPKDREIVGLIASSLAYGRVAQILKSVRKVLDVMKRPADYVKTASPHKIERDFSGFRHRFTDGNDVALLIRGMKNIYDRHGSMENLFKKGMGETDETVLPALCKFIENFYEGCGTDMPGLLPHPNGGSACKRLHLFLRWMIRHDDVDPGGWKKISPSKLVVPLDTHMHRICRSLGLTKRKQADGRTAVEITNEFGKIYPDDPVRCDFSLTRLGILGISTGDDL